MTVHQVAMLQMVSTRDLQENLHQASGLIRQAAERGASLALLPENFALFGSRGLREVAEAESVPGGGPILAFLAEHSRRHGIWLVAGSMPMAHTGQGQAVSAGRVRASCLVYDPQGECRARYDKLHLFDAAVADGHGRYRESDSFEPGDTPVTLDSPIGRLGLSICYDLRFPEYYRMLRAHGAQCLLVPSAFTHTTGQAHWEPLLRARAIENQCWVLAANQGGWHDRKRRTWGHSMVIDPWGEVTAVTEDEGPQVLMASVDNERMEKIRSDMPVWSHRRLLD
ncbi:MAG: carbon-nitrogen hydrolase family protein [Oleiphilaceae bacterium]|nr:carbon-nitrogen hydrolase family protein [Oleiphilaceae bacterium]